MKSLTLVLLSTVLGLNTLAQTGHIIKIDAVGNEGIMEKAYVKNEDNSIHYFPIMQKKEIVGYNVVYNETMEQNDLKKEGLDNAYNFSTYEMWTNEESDQFLSDVNQTLATKLSKTITAESAEESGKSMMGNMGSNVAGNNKYSFNLPDGKLKKTVATADEYYEIKMSMQSGGESTDIKNNVGALAFNAKVTVTAYSKDGTELWEKEGESNDFNSVFSPEDILEAKKADFINVKRTPRLTDQYTNEPIGDYTSLTKDEAQKCFLIALNNVLDQ